MSTADDYPLLAEPHIRLYGQVNEALYKNFRDEVERAVDQETLVISLCTLGGDPEIARAMGDDVRLLRDFNTKKVIFLGKQAVYSAGATFMSYFPREDRFLTKQTRIMVHERQMVDAVQLNGPLSSCVSALKAKLNEIEHSIRIEEEGFAAIAQGTDVTFEEIKKRAPANWYIEAEEAKDMGLVLDVV
ncbi:MAG: ATP-dependent Clp protease proteolytic subunit [Pseudomonadota bacterium]